jgi:hypothetical protein
MRLLSTKSQSLAASQTLVIDLEPGDNAEEWEILYAMVQDSSNIDVADTAAWSYRDELIGVDVVLQVSTLANVLTNNRSLFPNRDVALTSSNKNSIQTSIGGVGFITKRRDNKTSWLKFRSTYVSTGTVGSRTISVQAIILRRRLI